MAIVRITKGKLEGLWKATITFKNAYCRKGHSEVFETKYDAKDWIEGIKKFSKADRRKK